MCGCNYWDEAFPLLFHLSARRPEGEEVRGGLLAGRMQGPTPHSRSHPTHKAQPHTEGPTPHSRPNPTLKVPSHTHSPFPDAYQAMSLSSSRVTLPSSKLHLILPNRLKEAHFWGR